MIPSTTLQRPERSEPTTALAPLTIIRTDTVFSKLPIHTLAKRGSVTIHIAQHNAAGTLDLYWQVSPHPVFGAPRQLAYKLDTLVINRRLDGLGRPLPELIYLGTLRDMAHALHLGSDTAAVKRALRQNAHTVIAVKLTYTDTQGVEHEAAFESTRYGVILTGERLPDGRTADAVYIVLNPPYRHVLNNAPTRPLDYDYLQALTPAAQRWYELLSYKFFAAIKYGHPHAKQLYSEYCTFSAQPRYPDYTHVKKQMYKIHKPHITSQYLTSVRYERTPDADGLPDWCMYYVPGPKTHAEYAAFNPRSRRRAERPAAVLQAAAPEAVTRLDVEPSAATPHPAAVVPEAPPTAAHDLVQHFRQGLVVTPTRRPSAKELQQAATLLQEHGDERARAIVTYALREARRTDFQMQHFGAVLGYQEAALAALTQQAQQTQQREATRQRQAAEEQQRQQQWAEDARAAAVLAALPEAQREAYRQRVQAELPAFLRDMDGMVERRMRALVIEAGLVASE